MAFKGIVHLWGTFVADLEYPVGSEQGGVRRLVIVVSNDGFNAAVQRSIEDRLIEHLGLAFDDPEGDDG